MISEKQRKIILFPYTTKYQSLICDGAVRSGKTSLMSVTFIDWAMREFDNTNFAICGKTVGSAIRNIIMPYLSMTYHKDKYNISFTRSNNTMVVKYGEKTNTFILFGGKDESSFQLIQGLTCAGILFDEIALMTQSFVEEALARCLTYSNRRYFMNCNPDSPSHWFYQEWILQPEKHKALHLHFLMTDNPALDEETIRQAENDFSGVFYERKVLGRWVIAQGLVYPHFNIDFNVVTTQPRPYETYWITNDFGVQHACVFQLWGLANGIYYLIKEYYHAGQDGKQKTVEEYYEDLLKFSKGYRIKQFFLDNAPIASSFNVYLRRKQQFATRNADNDVAAGIQEVSSALKTGLIKINDCCKNTINEFGLYSWDDRATEDVPIKESDDCMDCLRYFVKTLCIAVPKRKPLV